MRALAGLLLALLPAVAAAGEVVSERPDAARVVIYRDPNGAKATNGTGQGVAFVVETRAIDLPAGPSTIRFRGVADTMVAQTATTEGLPAPAEERDFDYDLLTAGSLVKRAVGETVGFVRTLPRSGKAVEQRGVLTTGPDGVLIRTAEGVEAFQCSGLPEKLVFDRLPNGLADSPTLSLRTTSPKAGRYVVTLSYLATGFNWSADYVATVAPDGRSLAVHGWLTLANQSRTSFPPDKTEVVAGKLERSDDTRPVAPQTISVQPDCWTTATWAELLKARGPPPNAPSFDVPAPPPPPAPMMMKAALGEVVVTATRQATVSDLGDLKLYTLPGPTPVAAQQIKQVAFLDKASVPFRRVYTFRGDEIEDDRDVDPDDGSKKAELMLRAMNETSGGLGVALPSGVIRIMQTGKDLIPLFIGERPLRDTSVGLPVEVGVGLSDKVRPSARVIRSKQGKLERAERTLTFRNTSVQPALIEVRQDVTDTGFRLVSEGQPHTNRANDLVWSLALPPGGTGTVRYVAEALKP